MLTSDNEKILIDKNLLDLKRIPKHIAIIMDGNGRWAQKRGWPRTMGHKAGAETLRKIVRAAGALDVKAITAYAFSTENWKRPSYEVNFLMNLLDLYLTGEVDSLNKENVKVIFSGDISALPDKVRQRAGKTVAMTANNSKLTLNLAVNYGGQAEILHAIKAIITDVKSGQLKAGEITGDIFANYLYTAELPALDLLIRPGGDMRISNFLLWQIAYAEIWFTGIFWPDFTENDFYQAIYDFQNRDRRFGDIKIK